MNMNRSARKKHKMKDLGKGLVFFVIQAILIGGTIALGWIMLTNSGLIAFLSGIGSLLYLLIFLFTAWIFGDMDTESRHD